MHTHDIGARLVVGAVLPAGRKVDSVRLDGRPVHHQLVTTARGVEVRVEVTGTSATLDVELS